jgi:Tfp pilus assembly protein PilF
VTLTLRATLRQSQHDFDGALADLDRVIRSRPNDPQPYVTRAVVLTVLARYPEARADCTELARRAPPLVSAVCAENVESLTGHAVDAYARLLAASTGGTRLSPAEDAWVASSLGEMAVRAGKPAEGRAHFERALAAEPGDPYVLAALSDLDLDEGKPERVVARLAGKEENDTLLLRLALAEHATGAKDADRHRKLLDDRFRASRLRGDVVHRREESRFTLALLDDPARALVLAVENWGVQREVADARILLEAAVAARDPNAAEPVIAWLDSSRCEEPSLIALRKALGK